MRASDPNPVQRRTSQAVVDRDPALAAFMSTAFLHMTIGLALTAAVAWFGAASPNLLALLDTGPVLIGAFIITMVLVVWMGAATSSMSPAFRLLMFYVITALFGVMLVRIPILYPELEILRALAMTAAGFLGLALFGYTTRIDLGPVGAFCVMGLFGLIIGGLVNWFLQSPGLAWVMSIASLIVFSGLTAWDVQKLKEMHDPSDSPEIAAYKSVNGALALYLDFLNLFLAILRIFGSRR